MRGLRRRDGNMQLETVPMPLIIVTRRKGKRGKADAAHVREHMIKQAVGHKRNNARLKYEKSHPVQLPSAPIPPRKRTVFEDDE